MKELKTGIPSPPLALFVVMLSKAHYKTHCDYGLVCLPSDALSQHLLSYLGFCYLGRGVSLHGCSSKVQPLLLTLDEGYLLTTTLPDLHIGFSRGRSGGLVFPSLSEFSTVYYDPHKGFGIVNTAEIDVFP